MSTAAEIQSLQKKLNRYLEETIKQLPAVAKNVMPRIDGIDRKLMAVRGYLIEMKRGGPQGLMAKWVLTPKEADDRLKQIGKSMRDELKAIKTQFEKDNKGFTLGHGSEYRNLDSQIKNWNDPRNVSVKTKSGTLKDQALKELSRVQESVEPGVACNPPGVLQSRSSTPAWPVFPGTLCQTVPVKVRHPVYNDSPTAADIKRFNDFLGGYQFDEEPSVATPGLSYHGRCAAIDFTITGPGVSLGAESTKIKMEWDGKGWTAKLKDAISKAGPHFDGPLPNPYEPWHYNYEP